MFYTTHQISVPNKNGGSTVFKLQQDLGADPGAPKKLPILKEPVINFSFSNDYGEGFLTYYTSLELRNNYDDNLITLFNSVSSEREFRLLIEVSGTELFLGFFDFNWFDEQLRDSAAAKHSIEVTFANGMNYSDRNDISELLDLCDATTNNIHTFQDSDKLGRMPIVDIFGEVIFNQICGYDSDRVLVAHDWEAENWGTGVSGNVQFRELQINPYFADELISNTEWIKQICRSFTMNVGYSWKLGHPVMQDLRKGKNGGYTSKELIQVANGFRNLGSVVDMDLQDAHKIIEKNPLKPTSRGKIKQSYLSVAVKDFTDNLAYVASLTGFPTLTSKKSLVPEIPFDPDATAEGNNPPATKRNGISVPNPSVPVAAGRFKGHYAPDTNQLDSIWKAIASSQASYSRFNQTYEYNLLLTGLVDPMLPVEIRGANQRVTEGELYPVKLQTRVYKSVEIMEDYTNVFLP